MICLAPLTAFAIARYDAQGSCGDLLSAKGLAGRVL
jgi:hypothetical protein